jgi:hypothetical protein
MMTGRQAAAVQRDRSPLRCRADAHGRPARLYIQLVAAASPSGTVDVDVDRFASRSRTLDRRGVAEAIVFLRHLELPGRPVTTAAPGRA